MKLSLGLTPRDYSVAGGAVAYDTDAQAYFTANTAITTTADKNAINTFFLGLKSDGIYTKIKAMYLPIWGSAATSKWNLVNPVDSDAAFRLTFATGMTFTSQGMTGNGTSAYANTFLNPNTTLALNNTHLSFYSRTDVNLSQVEIGNQDASSYLILELRTANVTYNVFNQPLSGVYSYADTSSIGLYMGSRTGSTVVSGYKNGVKKLTGSTSSVTIPNKNIFIGALNNVSSVPQYYSTKQCCFSSIGNGLTDTESVNFSNRINTLMTYFGLNTY